MGVRTFFLFKNQCHASFRQGWYCFDSALEEIDCDTGDDFFLASYFNWQAGPGLIGLGVATFAKILDLLCYDRETSYHAVKSPISSVLIRAYFSVEESHRDAFR